MKMSTKQIVHKYGKSLEFFNLEWKWKLLQIYSKVCLHKTWDVAKIENPFRKL